jgi:hypothetical protein
MAGGTVDAEPFTPTVVLILRCATQPAKHAAGEEPSSQTVGMDEPALRQMLDDLRSLR